MKLNKRKIRNKYKNKENSIIKNKKIFKLKTKEEE